MLSFYSSYCSEYIKTKRISKRCIVNFRRSKSTNCWNIVKIFVFLGSSYLHGLVSKIPFLEHFVKFDFFTFFLVEEAMN